MVRSCMNSNVLIEDSHQSFDKGVCGLHHYAVALDEEGGRREGGGGGGSR